MSRRNAVSRAAFAKKKRSLGGKGRNNDSKKLPRSSCDEVMKTNRTRWRFVVVVLGGLDEGGGGG